MHKRYQFLTAIRDQINAANSIFAGCWIRRSIVKRSEYPGVIIYWESESVLPETIHPVPRLQDRRLDIVIEVFIRGLMDDERTLKKLDEAATEVEKIVTAPVGVESFYLIACDQVVSDDDCEVHSVQLRYALNYVTTEFDPEN